MASRAKKRANYRAQQYTAQMRSGGVPGTYEYAVEIAGLPAPEREFYANTARVAPRANYCGFSFGHFGVGSRAVQNAVSIDIPYRALQSLAATFDEKFREAMAISTQGLSDIEPFTAGPQQIQSVGFGSQLARVMINNFAGTIDFFELEPNIGPPKIGAIIRIKTLPALVKWFVESCDKVVREIPGLQSEVVPTP